MTVDNVLKFSFFHLFFFFGFEKFCTIYNLQYLHLYKTVPTDDRVLVLPVVF